MTRKRLDLPIRFFEKDSAWYVCPSRFDKSEPPPNKHPDYREERKLIFIPAVPSSGTSALAAVLMMLGVDMGRFGMELAPPRGYTTYEDKDVSLFRWEIEGPQDRLMRMRMRFRDYINYRFVRTPEGPVGAKGLPLYWLQESDPVTLPLVTVDIRRPLEDAIVADVRTLLTAPERDPESRYRSAYDHASRAGGIASCYLGKLLMFEVFPPVASIDYYELLESPEKNVMRLIEALGLEPNEQQVRDAIRVVRPEARHV